MRALDCSDPGKHEDVHFSAADDEELFAQVKQHTTEFHPEMGDDAIRQMISSDAYDE